MNEQDYLGIRLTMFLPEGELKQLWLPIKPDGSYRFADPRKSGAGSCAFLSVDAMDGQWIAVCHEDACFYRSGNDRRTTSELIDGQVLVLRYRGERYILCVEYQSKKRATFTNYSFCMDTQISIGRDRNCSIWYDSGLVTEVHAYLRRMDGIWYVTDNHSTNGTFVNGYRIDRARLEPGDEIYIMGLRIIIGVDFLAINDGDEKTTVRAQVGKRLDNAVLRSAPDGLEKETVYFNRQPRVRIPHNQEKVTLECPPPSLTGSQIPMMLSMGSSIFRGGMSMMSGNFSMMISSVLFPVLTQQYTDKQRREYEGLRLTKYSEYLFNKQKEISDRCMEEENWRNAAFPQLDEVLRYTDRGDRMWERRPLDEDFLRLRLGQGELEWCDGIDYPERRFEVTTDDLTQRMYEIAQKRYLLKNVPITMSLVEDFVCGIIGVPKVRLALVKQLLMQIAVLHSYDEVKLILLASEKDLQVLSFARYLPHCWDSEGAMRLTASNAADAYRIAEYIKNRMGEKFASERDLRKTLKTRPYYVVCALDKKLLDSMEFLKEVLLEDDNHGLSVIAAFDQLPKECSRIVRLTDHGLHTLIGLKGIDGDVPQTFEMDRFDPVVAQRSMKVLANTKLHSSMVAGTLPKSCAFLDMFGAGRVEHLNSRKRWRESDPIRSLAAPIGVATDGSVFELDLHEKFQGPHGLVAGMTGSGKSQFLISYILAMAVNYHPDEVAFILIDYKGGGLADAFYDEAKGVRLPHLVGTITNLDGTAIQRSLMSIESEIKRRQRIFREANSKIGEGTMDIYTYQKLYRSKKVDEPIPHLFIISDEFAELKNQQPGFMAQLISMARIGRSLGVHLILATQRPAGVVSEEIRSNAKVKICLRVQDRADSMDMLKRPEAAELRDTGRFYLQVGYNEFFAMGQSAYCGLPYEPKDTVPIRRDEAVEFLDMTGRVILRNAHVPAHQKSDSKELVAIVKYLSDLAAEEHYKVKMLWKDPLPKVLAMDEVEEVPLDLTGNSCRAVLGRFDDPENQAQDSMVLDLFKCQNLAVVGEAGCGKSTLLETMLYSVSERNSPRNVNYWIIDLSGKQLAAFSGMPHCGAYLTDEDESSFDRFFSFLSEEMGRRRQLFRMAGVNSYEQYLEESHMPLMLVVIDNLAAFNKTSLGGSHQFMLQEYLRSGPGCGIKFIVTANFPGEITMRVRQEIGTKLALRSKDKYAYGDILGARVTYTPGEMPGRGMFVDGERPLAFQTAMVARGTTVTERNSIIKQKLRVIQERYPDYRPELAFRLSGEAEYYEEFCGKFMPGRLPLGYALPSQKPVALPLRQLGYLSLYFGNPRGVVPVLNNLLYGYRRENMKIVLVKRLKNSVFDGTIPVDDDMTVFTNALEDTNRLFDYLCKEAAARNQLRDTYCREKGIPLTPPASTDAAFDEICSKSRGLVVLVEAMAEFCQLADEYRKKTMPACFKALEGKHCYFAGCFYADDPELSSFDPIMKAFNSKQQVMLFGGCYTNQRLVVLRKEHRDISKVSPKYDHCLMHYRDEFYPLYMPCGPLTAEEGREDERSIFG